MTCAAEEELWSSCGSDLDKTTWVSFQGLLQGLPNENILIKLRGRGNTLWSTWAGMTHWAAGAWCIHKPRFIALPRTVVPQQVTIASLVTPLIFTRVSGSRFVSFGWGACLSVLACTFWMKSKAGYLYKKCAKLRQYFYIIHFQVWGTFLSDPILLRFFAKLPRQ